MPHHEDEDSAPEYEPAVDPIAAKKAEDERYAQDLAYLRTTLNMTEDEVTNLLPTEAARRAFITDSRRLANEGGDCVDEETAPKSKKAKKAVVETLSEEEQQRVGELEVRAERRKKRKAGKSVTKQVAKVATEGAAMLKEDERPSTEDYEAAINLFKELADEDDD